YGTLEACSIRCRCIERRHRVKAHGMKLAIGRRRAVAALAGAAGAGLAARPAPGCAQQRPPPPPKEPRVLVGFIRDGGADIAARRIAVELQRRLSRHIHVTNRPGKSGALAGELLKKGPADGSVVAFLPSTTLTTRLISSDFPFDPTVDLAPI